MNDENFSANSRGDIAGSEDRAYGVGGLVAAVWVVACIIYINFARPYGYSISESELLNALLWVGLSTAFVFGVATFAAPKVLWPARRGVDRWSKERQREELAEFVNALKDMDAEEIGLPVAFAANFRNRMLDHGVDLTDPLPLVTANPGIIYEISRKVVALQKQGETAAAVPLMVWVHSLRATARPELRSLGREMWGQLERGFNHAEEAARGYEMLTEEHLNIVNFDEFPKGLTPQPLN